MAGLHGRYLPFHCPQHLPLFPEATQQPPPPQHILSMLSLRGDAKGLFFSLLWLLKAPQALRAPSSSQQLLHPRGKRTWKGQECVATDQTSCLRCPLTLSKLQLRKQLAPHLENGDNEPQLLGAIEGLIDSWWQSGSQSWPGIPQRLLCQQGKGA